MAAGQSRPQPRPARARAALGPLAWLIGALLSGCAGPAVKPPTAASPVPEAASGLTAKPGWATRRFAVAAANPLATEAGDRILRAGGSALDAAVAVQMVLALVEPQSSGLGGGAFLLHWDGQQVQAWDGRETAPAGADERLLLGPDGRPLPLPQAVASGRAVGVPGAVRMLEAAHRQHGRLPWATLFEPAIALAEQGFPVSARLHTMLQAADHLRRDARAARFFFLPDGQPLPIDHRLRNPALAQVLRSIARQGSSALHDGPVAADIVARVQGHATLPGRMTAADLAAYQPVRREPLCTDWQTSYRICGMPPPSSGHLTVMQILGLVDHASVAAPALQDGIPSAAWLHTYTEAARLAYADRNQYIADPDFTAPPGGDWRSLLGADYLRQRAGLIGPTSMTSARPGTPAVVRVAYGTSAESPEHGTSHLSIVDADGRAVAMTTTIEAAWGSGLLSDGGSGLPGGFLLNNQLTDFSPEPADAQGRPIANRVQAGKRPRSSMSPTLVFDRRDGRLLMSLGSPGGATIIHFVAKTLIGSFDWGLDAQRAIDLPNFGSLNGPTLLERGRFPASTVDALRARGHTVLEVDLPSGLQAIQRTPTGWFGGADPRREGVVMGD
ncbi:gamma-glutamyltransferase family protein [Ideonella sp. A 288]|uniref:gamma-glutamyltransferase family protein n=1 Tax=Ideonella sp. A 288 TaxID=1962181 RepID=UPI000B4ADCE2|nr:gamma-glutamyltransferase family protein [Ideonella sp. A 288]